MGGLWLFMLSVSPICVDYIPKVDFTLNINKFIYILLASFDRACTSGILSVVFVGPDECLFANSCASICAVKCAFVQWSCGVFSFHCHLF